MRIRYIKAKNFLSFKDVEIPLDKDLNIIVGPNNSGKTNVARALKLVADIIDGKRDFDFMSFLHDQNERYFRLEISYELSKEEKQDIEKFMSIYIKTYNYSRFDPRSIAWESYLDLEHTPSIDRSLFYEQVSKAFKDTVKNLLEYIAELVSKGRIVLEFKPHTSIDPYLILELENGETIKIMNTSIGSDRLSERLPSLFTSNIKHAVSQQTLDEIKRFFLGHIRSISALDIDVKKFLSRIAKTYLDAPVLSYGELSADYRTIISDIAKKYDINVTERVFITLVDIVLKIFSTRLVILKEIRGEPKKEFSLDDLRVNEITTQIYRGTGSDLALSLLGLKNSENLRDRANYKKICKVFKDLTGFDFDVSFNLNEKRLLIWILSNNKQFLIDYAGSGFLEILNILRAVIGNKDCIIVLDEPAAHLHPSKQLDLLNKIKSEAMGNNNQLMIITHSPYFISSDNIKNVIRFQIEDGQTKIYKPQEFKDPKLSRIFDNPRFKSALFSNGVILAEGISEALSLPYFLKKSGFDLEDRNIEIISAIGDTGFDKYIQVLDQFGIPWVIVCDGKAITHSGRGCKYIPKVFCQLNAIDKLEESDRERIIEIAKDKEKYEQFKDNELDELIEIAKRYNVFVFRDADFNNFLKKEFEDEYNQVLVDFGLSEKRDKPEIALILAQRLPPEKVQETSEFKELIELMKQTFKM